MANIKQIGIAACTFSVALGIGFVMQNGDALASRFAADANESGPAPFTDTTIPTEQTSQTEDAPVAPNAEPEKAPIVLPRASAIEVPAPSAAVPVTALTDMVTESAVAPATGTT